MKMKITFLSIGLIANLGLKINAAELTHQHLGQIAFGQNLSSLNLSFKSDGEQLGDCRYVIFDKYPNVSVMIIDGVIQRIDTQAVSVIDPSQPFYFLITGTQSFKDFKSQYPEIEIVQHEYLTGFYLRWYNQDKSKVIVVDLVDGKVDQIKAGLTPAALWIEGCA